MLVDSFSSRITIAVRGRDDGENPWPVSTEMHVKLRVFCSAFTHACVHVCAAAWRPFVRPQRREAQAELRQGWRMFVSLFCVRTSAAAACPGRGMHGCMRVRVCGEQVHE